VGAPRGFAAREIDLTAAVSRVTNIMYNVINKLYFFARRYNGIFGYLENHVPVVHASQDLRTHNNNNNNTYIVPSPFCCDDFIPVRVRIYIVLLFILLDIGFEIRPWSHPFYCRSHIVSWNSTYMYTTWHWSASNKHVIYALCSKLCAIYITHNIYHTAVGRLTKQFHALFLYYHLIY